MRNLRCYSRIRNLSAEALNLVKLVLIDKLTEAILAFNTEEALRVTLEALKEGMSPQDLIEELRRAAGVIGERYESGEYFISDLIIAGSIMKTVASELAPIRACKQRSRGKIIIGSAPGDVHDIGKNLVATLLLGAGFQIVDLGVDVPPEKFVQAEG